ncbi:MAG TPA: hypothetical protein PK657_02570 [Legionella sp.]|nr:hypothetical protein [Legionella sp.]
MILLDIIENAVGNEYLGDAEHLDICVVEDYLTMSSNQLDQPSTNKIVSL